MIMLQMILGSPCPPSILLGAFQGFDGATRTYGPGAVRPVDVKNSCGRKELLRTGVPPKWILCR